MIKIRLAVLSLATHLLLSSPATGQESLSARTSSLSQSGLWRFSNSLHSNFQTLGSIDAQHGHHLVEIDSSAINFPFEYFDESRGYIKTTYPQGFLFQSISAEQFIGKHLHISAFAKSLKPDFGLIAKRFDDWFIEEKETELVERLELKNTLAPYQRSLPAAYLDDLLRAARVREFEVFADYLRSSHRSATFGVSVLLHFKEDQDGKSRVALYAPTSIGASRENERWNRFNVELSIPANCRTISIVLWSKGVNIVHYDHLAVVAHGDALSIEPQRYNLGSLDEIYKAVMTLPAELNTQFQNLSFEK